MAGGIHQGAAIVSSRISDSTRSRRGEETKNPQQSAIGILALGDLHLIYVVVAPVLTAW